MKTILRNTAVATLALAAVSGASFGASGDGAPPPPGAISIEEALRSLTAAGYTNIRKIEFEHGSYEAKVYDAAGRRLKLLIDPTTGAITRKENKKRRDRSATMGSAAAGPMPASVVSRGAVTRMLERQGYRSVESVDIKGSIYEARVTDTDGKSYKLAIDPANGKILPPATPVAR